MLPHAEQLVLVPEQRWVVETLGLQPGIWGCFFIIVGCLFALECKPPLSVLEWEILGLLAVAGLGLTAWELRRRRARTVLVRDGEYISVYRKGRLDMTLDPEDIRLVKADLLVMLKVGVPLGVCAVGFTVIGLMMMLRDRMMDAGSLSILALGLACGASFACAAWTRFWRCHLRVPVRGLRWLAEETVLVTPAQLKGLIPTLEEAA
ncbi:MAG TPA: hypothetical protein PLR60_07990 [Syntrophorhabdaceae bacterium]|nr:hypothetical protein [Syntrophorhabdaceae bacterium]